MPPITEESGIIHVHSLANKMGFIFRRQDTHDEGIDAHIETTFENRRGTARNIGLQIKSGDSYYQTDQDSNLIYRASERHIHYWAEHSLPTIIVIYSTSRETAWWCNLKEYFSRNPKVLSLESNIIRVPLASVFSIESKSELEAIAGEPSHLLSLEMINFDLISHNIGFSGGVIKCWGHILIGQYANREMARIAIFKAIQQLKGISLEDGADKQKGTIHQLPDIIFLYVYKDLTDRGNNLLYGTAVWRSPDNDATQRFHFNKPNDFTDDIDIEFADENRQQVMREFYAKRVIPKSEFLKRSRVRLEIMDNLISQASFHLNLLDTGNLNSTNFDESMILLAKTFDEFERTNRDETSPTPECRDAANQLAGIIGSGINVFLPYTPQGLKTWDTFDHRIKLLKMYLKRYEVDRTALGFEFKRLER